MKRIFLALALMMISYGAFAGELGIALENLFDGRYDSNSKVEWSKIKRSGQLSYYLEFNNDPAILKEVMTALKNDMKGEEFDTEIVTKNDTYYRTSFDRNGYEIKISLSIPKKGRCNLIIKSSRLDKDAKKSN